MREHPEELLAEYVDGALSPELRADVEDHLATCTRCTEEVALAGEATGRLRELEPVDPPFGLTRTVVRSARGPRLWERPAAWAAAGAAAAVIGVFAYLGLRSPSGEIAVERGAADAPAAAPTEDTAAQPWRAAADSVGGYPALLEGSPSYAPDSLVTRSRELAGEARTAIANGFPPTATAFYSQVDLRALPEAAAEVLRCAGTGTPPDEAAVPFVLERGEFEGIPAYLVSFLRGEGPDAPYDQIQLLVVDRETCSIRHFSRERL